MNYPAFLIAFFTTIVQCYDYSLFGLSAAILSKIFMPDLPEEKQLLSFFAIFGFSVVIRPIGALIFGKIGDLYGRAASMKIASAAAALSITIIGFSPSYSKIGISATVILTLCRMLLVVSHAGEIDATRIYVAEKMAKYKTLANGIVSCCNQLGALLAATCYHYAISSSFNNLWRLNFIVGGSFGIIIILLRHYFQESEEFLKYKHKKDLASKSEHSIGQLIVKNKKKFIAATLISGSAGGIYHFLIIFLATFSIKITPVIVQTEAHIINIQFIAIYSISALISGLLADIFGFKKQIIAALLLSLVCGCVMQYFAIKGMPVPTLLITIIVGLIPFYTVPLHIIIQSLFTVDIRVRMCSLSHSIGGMIFSSNTPFFCMQIWNKTKSFPLVLIYLLCLITIIFCSFLYLQFFNKNDKLIWNTTDTKA